MDQKRILELKSFEHSWKALFNDEVILLNDVLGQNCLKIHHIGSTAIPGILAKPIIDMMPVVNDIMEVDHVNKRMIAAGYTIKGEFGIPGRRFFIKGNQTQRTHHVHVYQSGHDEIERHLNFRDYLCHHAEEAKRYSELKRKLLGLYREDPEKYSQGKTDLIRELDQKAYQWKMKSMKSNKV